MGAAIGGLVASVVGSAVSSVVGSMMSSLVSNFGGGNIAGALANAFMGSLGNALNSVIDNSPLPQFLKDAAKDVIGNVIGGNQQATTPEAQDAVDNEYGDMLDNISQGICKDAADKAEGKEGGNWLVALARGLSEVQVKFLDAAMENMDTMKNNSVDETKSKKDQAEDRQEFIQAQSEYQANMQMFNMMANMTATSLKSLGEGLTAIARKQ
ncbi:MAG: hypothetical protein L3J88_08055 [Gammaproteobacteria bacterium]|nr:hypothetical protein [Gammaproteobacteria bacterium]